jgi:hypothetical protein
MIMIGTIIMERRRSQRKSSNDHKYFKSITVVARIRIREGGQFLTFSAHGFNRASTPESRNLVDTLLAWSSWANWSLANNRLAIPRLSHSRRLDKKLRSMGKVRVFRSSIFMS